MPDDIKAAKKRIKRKKKFYEELGSWVSISILLVIINSTFYTGIKWAWIPIAAWGVVEDMGYDPEIDYEELDLDDVKELNIRSQQLYKDSDLV